TPVAAAPAVAVFLALLALAEHPGNSAAAFHVATSPLGRALGQDGASYRRGAAALAADARREIDRLGLAGALERWREVIAGQASARDLEKLDKLIDLAEAHEAAGTAGMSGTGRAGGTGGLASFVALAREKRVEDPVA